MPATTADRDIWAPGLQEWGFDVLDGLDDREEIDPELANGDLPQTLEWENGTAWAEDSTGDYSDHRQNLVNPPSSLHLSRVNAERDVEQSEEDMQYLPDNDFEELDFNSSPGFHRRFSSSPELDYDTSQGSTHRHRDRRDGNNQNEAEAALPFGYVPFAFDQHDNERHGASRLPSIGNIVDLTGSSPSQRMTALAPRAYNSHSSLRDNRLTGSGSNSTAPVPEPTQQQQPEPKRRRNSLTISSTLSSSSSSSESSLVHHTLNSARATAANRNSRTLPPPRNPTQRPPLPPISDYLRMPTTPAEIESIDLRNVDDDSSLSRVLAQQREQAILAQNASAKPEEEDFTKSIMTHYKCPVCMDVLTNATATACGHLFCHKCITDTLKFGERRAEEEGNPPRGNCPVCRKAISRNSTGNSKQLIQLKLMTRGKKQAQTQDEKGKGKEVEVGGVNAGEKRKREERERERDERERGERERQRERQRQRQREEDLRRPRSGLVDSNHEVPELGDLDWGWGWSP